MSDLVIGEGVALDLRLAKLPSRALGRILDLLIQAGAFGVLAAVLGVVSSSGTVDDAVMAGLMILMVVVVLVGYPALFETVAGGRTIGKMAMGLRVVRGDGGPVRFRHALVRALTGIFDFYATAGVLAMVTSFCSKQGRRTGDWLAGTVVVRDRAPDAGVGPAGMAALAMPYPLLGWAQKLDLSALPDDVALSARQYLTRVHEMREDVSARMGHELASEVMRYVALPPAGTPPWAYLAAVTAERRVRQMRAEDAARRAAWERGQAQALLHAQAQAQAQAPAQAQAWAQMQAQAQAQAPAQAQAWAQMQAQAQAQAQGQWQQSDQQPQPVQHVQHVPHTQPAQPIPQAQPTTAPTVEAQVQDRVPTAVEVAVETGPESEEEGFKPPV